MTKLKGIFATAGQNTGRKRSQAAGKPKMRATGGRGSGQQQLRQTG
jgi:hypothetical protein